MPADTLPSIDSDTNLERADGDRQQHARGTTFSLSIMVSSLSSLSLVASGASPRATELVMGDDNTQNAIAAFIAAFTCTVVAQIALGIGFHGSSGRFVLFVAPVMVLLSPIYTLMMWGKTLLTLGRMGHTLAKPEQAATEAMLNHPRSSAHGCAAAARRCGARVGVLADRVGQIRCLDMAALQRHASEAGGLLHIRVRPGAQVYPGTALAACESAHGFDAAAPRDAFVIGAARADRQDPRFGPIVLSEVVQCALAPAVNDPGTAVAVMNTLARVLIDARPSDAREDEDAGDAPPDFDRLTLPALDERDLTTQPFDAIARNGAAVFEVQARMQKVRAAIAAGGCVTLAPAAHRQAARALERADLAAMFDDQNAELRRLYERLHARTELPRVL